jgi:metal-responsive CopG/Arc/MetJ family transcriptional regulator
MDERLPEQGTQDEYQRFEMRMSQQLLDGLGAMADQEGLTRADVVRRALGLYARALQAEAQGQCIAFATLHLHNAVDVVQLIKLK